MQLKNPVQQNNEPAQGADSVVNAIGYRFVDLDCLPVLQADMLEKFKEIGVKGTILLAEEGINAAFAGQRSQIEAVRAWFEQDERFAGLWLKESPSDFLPFSKLKVKIRKEIIAFQPDADNPVSPARNPAPEMNPAKLKQWLDDKANFTLLDTRNDYEVVSGTFEQALNLKLNTFKEFATAVDTALESGELDLDKPVVTFCTGGIRCEKAAPYLIEQGFKEVYQVKGGILNYFEQCSDAHWKGNCFVFDDRAEVNASLLPTGAELCDGCSLAISADKDNCVCGTPKPSVKNRATPSSP